VHVVSCVVALRALVESVCAANSNVCMALAQTLLLNVVSVVLLPALLWEGGRAANSKGARVARTLA